MVRKIGLIVLGTTLLFTALKAEGAGFQNPPQGTAASAQGGAFVAQADDATAITHNPAGLTQLTGTAILLAPSFIYPSTEYYAPNGQKEKAKETLHVLPNLYFATGSTKTNWRFGLGITTPFGQSSEWSKDGLFRYYTTFSEMKLIDVNPAIAYAVNPQLSFGLGLNYYNSAITLEAQNYYGAYGPFPDGSQKLAVEGDGYGYNLGFLYKPSEKHSIGGTFRSGFSIKHEGHLSMTEIPVALGGPDFKTSASLEMNFPNIANLGYAYRPNKRWKIEVDMEWIEWSWLEKMTVDLTPPLLPGLPAHREVVKEWNSTLSPRIGIEFRPDANWKIWTGYVYLPTSIPDRTFDPSLPDANAHIFCLGFGWEKKNLAMALSQEFSFPEDRKIAEGGAYDGTYKSFNLITTLNIQYNF
ncbi:MAG: outer membrane protein transport protein [Candidatus Ratteibacteria bacterium]|jgi:long-chain fatty acid transport protein